MTHPVDLRVVELMAARLCHDLIGPVSAINNGIELMADEDPNFIRDAVALVGDSAGNASRRLQFVRFAYGFSGTGVSGASPPQLVADFFAGSNIECDYRAALRERPLPEQKLACAMATVAAEGLPRGGKLVLSASKPGPQIDASGTGKGPSAEAQAALTLAAPVPDLTSRTVVAYFAGLLADRLGWRLVVEKRPGGFCLAARAAS
jgi:histidine phosphotransferase ChpT